MTLAKLMYRLSEQYQIYHTTNPQRQRAMQDRALQVAGSTIRRRLSGDLQIFLPSAKLFVGNRKGLAPITWGKGNKVNFAKALCGHTLGEDGVCLDTWLNRNKIRPKSVTKQWYKWFAIYRLVYGEKKYKEALRIHMNWLDYIAGGKK